MFNLFRRVTFGAERHELGREEQKQNEKRESNRLQSVSHLPIQLGHFGTTIPLRREITKLLATSSETIFESKIHFNLADVFLPYRRCVSPVAFVPSRRIDGIRNSITNVRRRVYVPLFGRCVCAVASCLADKMKASIIVFACFPSLFPCC